MIPDPWHHQRDEGRWFVVDGRNRRVAVVAKQAWRSPFGEEAIARMLAIAPELAAAIQKALAFGVGEELAPIAMELQALLDRFEGKRPAVPAP